MNSDNKTITQWLNNEFEKAFTEKISLQERQSLSISWKEAVFSYPTLSALLLLQYRIGHENLPSYQHCYERYSQMCLELPHILSDSTMPLCNDALIGLAYALHTTAFEALPNKIKKRLGSDPNFDKSRVAKTYCSFFVLRLLKKWQDHKNIPFPSFEKNALAHFFKRQIFFPGPLESSSHEILSLIRCFINDKQRDLQQREQLMGAFIQSSIEDEFSARCRYLNEERDDLVGSVSLLKIVTQERAGATLSDIVGQRCCSLVEALPFFEKNYITQLFFIEQKKEALYQKLLFLVSKSSRQWERDFLLVGQPSGGTRYSREAGIGLWALPVIPFSLIRPVSDTIQPTTRRSSSQTYDLPFLLIEILGMTLATLWASELHRHRLTYIYFILSGVEPYSCTEAELRLEFRNFIDALSSSCDLDSTLQQLENILSGAGASFKYNFWGIECHAAPMLSVKDFDASLPASEQIRTQLGQLLQGMKTLSLTPLVESEKVLLLSPSKGASPSVCHAKKP